MAARIFLSPSNQKNNSYAYGNTTEDVQCGKIAEACKVALERCGFEVKLMHYYDMVDKVAAADGWQADLYVPIHTNAYNGKTGGTRVFYYNKQSNGYKAAKAVYNELKDLTTGISDNITAYPELYEIRVPIAPSVYVEAEFHDNAAYAKWIIEHVVEIGEVICKGICTYFGVDYVEKVVDKPKVEAAAKELYRVQVGAYAVRENAEKMLAALKAAGFEGYIRQQFLGD